jgi:hypothetical protein
VEKRFQMLESNGIRECHDGRQGLWLLALCKRRTESNKLEEKGRIAQVDDR